MSRSTASRRKPRATIPGFNTFVNSSAGLAATGVRVGFPAERTVVLNYCDYAALAGTSGAMGLYQFRLNSAYDPNYTSAGHQPMGFDQWSLFYNHYVVESVDYQVQMASSTNAMVNMLTSLSDDPTVPTSVTELLELGGASTLWVPGVPAHIFKGRVETAKFLNRTDIAADPEVRASIAANPTEQIFLNLHVSSTDGLTTVNCIFHVKLSMKVRFMEPKDLAPSTGKAHIACPEYEYVRVKKI